mmetsp:Transcript_21035/g.45564  ORF Transcript_21035/g.45564 Transcript_21035/m.45564 type:complete len:395 (-) Transcript_21035:51-1235(-)|eukprot:CAMPEP_0206445850 /NCGR_PEP_ID=MMETSP0324_2-20121206/15771_1 /ASSEMBLY_ACC=CAM_ASM_000836 /TAXON_ID=2866 /ORGANISM="Crypthecodinium cohnii, Strain Seligo" /LENGTH=394 /DNA_ID=CAMNT_0053914179 /DNA_START=163 /DNA_END=1347 /DNA_ORIENTATION=-
MARVHCCASSETSDRSDKLLCEDGLSSSGGSDNESWISDEETQALYSEEQHKGFSSPSLQVGVLIVVWWGASIYVTLMVKLTAVGSVPHPMVHGVQSGPSPPVIPPFLMTSMVNVVTGIFSWITAKTLFRSATPIPSPSKSELGRILLLGAGQGFEIGCLNKSLQYITISERTMLQNSNILLMMLCAQIFGLERLTLPRILAGLLLVGGGVLQGLASSQQHHSKGAGNLQDAEHLRGIVFMLTSMLLTASKWSLIQCMTQRSEPNSFLQQVSKLQLSATVQPITGFVSFCLALFFEHDAIMSSSTWHSPLLWRVPTLALGIVIILGAELKLVEVTSAVATGVLMNLHHIPMVLVGVIIFHDQVSTTSIFGFGLCLLGGFVYAWARAKSGHDPAE